jgi:beta-lactamase regulating signal transducer with metallopeptidase domain
MLWWLAENTVFAAILAGIVALICRCFRPGPAVRHALWLVVLVKLLTPPLVHWPWPMINPWATISQSFVPDSASDIPSDPKPASPVNDSLARTEDTEVAFVLVEIESTLPAEESERFEFGDTNSSGQSDSPAETPALEQGDDGGGWRFFPSAAQILQVWLIGAVGMACWQLLQIGRFRRRLAGAKPAPELLVNLVEELADKLGVRPPRTVILSTIGSPLVWSLGRARLLFPDELLKRLSDASRRGVLLHELAHLRRRDHWVGWLQLVGSCLWWWNPLFWLVCRQVRENAELACDAWVVELLPEARRAYAEALIEVTQVIAQRAAPVAAFGLGHGRRREFERRLTMIMKECVPCRVPVRALVVIGLLALAVLPGWTLGQQAPDEETKPALPLPPAPAPVISPAPAVPQAPGNVAPLPTPAPAITPVQAPVAVPPGYYYVPVTTAEGVTSYQAVAAQPDQGGDRLEQIEKQLEALLKEVHAMRKGGRTPASATAKPANALPEAPPGTRVRTTARIEGPATTLAVVEGGEVTLTRKTYNLPNAKAEALGALLKDLKNEDIVTIVEGNKITVTTSPENQRLIAPFIALLNGQKDPRTYYYRPVPDFEPSGAAPALR